MDIKKNYALREGELYLLELLWKEGIPLAQSEIYNLVSDEKYKSRTILYNAIRSLLEKELIEVDGMVRSVKNYSRRFKPTLTQEEYKLRYIGIFDDKNRIPKMKNMRKLFASLVSSEDVSMEELDNLQAILDKRRELK